MAVTPNMIAVALGVAAPEPGSIKEQQWDLWISDAEMLIENRREKLEAAPLNEARVDYVVRESVVAHVKRPDDATQVTISVDDGSSSKTFRSGRGRVTITDEWWEFLGLTAQSGAFALDMVGRASGHPPWCSIYFGSACSCGVTIAGGPIYEPYDGGW